MTTPITLQPGDFASRGDCPNQSNEEMAIIAQRMLDAGGVDKNDTEIESFTQYIGWDIRDDEVWGTHPQPINGFTRRLTPDEIRSLLNDMTDNPAPTPCEQRGYKVGDRFKYLDCEPPSLTWSPGSILELVEDDGSDCPRFKLVTGYCGQPDKNAFAHLDNIEPTDDHGLPAVGERVWFNAGGDSFFPPEIRYGAKVEIIAHHNARIGVPVAVFSYQTHNESGSYFNVDQAIAECFHPLPDARQTWIDKVTKRLDDVNPDAAEAIHDALVNGDIKPPKVDQ